MAFVAYTRVVDLRPFVHDADSSSSVIWTLASSILRAAVGKITMKEIFDGRESLQEQAQRAAERSSPKWGLRLVKYFIVDFIFPPAILAAMEEKARRVREQRAAGAQTGASSSRITSLEERDRKRKERATRSNASMRREERRMASPAANQARYANNAQIVNKEKLWWTVF